MESQKNRKFLQQHLITDEEGIDAYLIIIEFENDIPVMAYPVKLPLPFAWCTIYPWILN